MNFDITFEETPVDRLIASLNPGDKLSAVQLLAALDGAGEEDMEDAFAQLEQLQVILDLSDLPRLGASGEAALRLREEEELAAKGDLTANLDPNDPLRLYLEELAAIPVCGDVNLLAEELLSGRDVQAQLLSGRDVQAQLLNLSLSRVVELAKAHTGRGVLLMDLIQEGSLGLWSGLPGYSGGDFESCRDVMIGNAMARAVIRQARQSGLGQKMRRAVEDYRMVDERLLMELGRNPTIEELAESLHMSVEETENVRKVLESARMMGKAHELPESEEEDPEDAQAVEDTAYYQTRERVDDLMSGLTEMETKLLNLRFGLDGKPPMTAAEAGKKLNMTVSQVVELEAAALAKMRREGE